MSQVVICMVKNERDLIQDFLDQCLALFDQVIVVDHESRDGTYEFCQRVGGHFPALQLYRLHSAGYPQSILTTWFSRRVFAAGNPDWIFFMDADEFLPFSGRDEFSRALAPCGSGDYLELPWRNLFPEPFGGWKGLREARFSAAAAPSPEHVKIALSRALFAKHGREFVVWQGHHGLSTSNGSAPVACRAPFELYHVPFRSPEQVERKLFLGNLAYRSAPRRAGGFGRHWAAMLEEYQAQGEGFFSSLRETVLAYGESRPRVASPGPQPAPVVFDYPESCGSDAGLDPGCSSVASLLWQETERLLDSASSGGRQQRRPGGAADAAPRIVLSSADGRNIFIREDDPWEDGKVAEEDQSARLGDGMLLSTTSGAGDSGDRQESPQGADPLPPVSEDDRRRSLLRQILFWMNVPPQRIVQSGWNGHLGFINALIGLARPQNIVELGVYRGASFFTICDAVRNHGLVAEVVGVDLWDGDQHAGSAGGDQMYGELSRRAAADYPFARLVRADFAAARRRVPDGVIDLLHIDGYHTLEAVSNDFRTWFSALSPRGICLFHDTAVRENNFGVYQFWNEVQQQWPAVEFTHGFGLGVLFVGRERTPELQDFLDLWNGSPLQEEAFRAAAELLSSTFPARLQGLETVHQCQHLQQQLASAGEVNANLKQQLDGVLSSKIWRATLVLRKTADWIRSAGR